MGILTILVLILIPMASFGSPVPTSRYEEWRDPCVGTPRQAPMAELPDFLRNDTPPPQSLPQTLGELVNQMKEARDKVQELKQNYTTSGRISQGGCNNLDAPYIKLDGFPSAPAFRGAMRMISEMNLTDILLTDYQKLSVVMVFIEQARWDEEAFESSYFLPALNAIYRNIKSLLCVLSNALRTRNAEVSEEHYARREFAMNQRYRTMSRSDNHDRDYIIMRDSYKFFSNLILKYTALKDFLSTSDQAV
uniref:Interleukin-6 n=1 Tax=Magallana gigas TaxID=29159 RepID=A0A8W8IG62_MAGGI|nr:uncharacterized protein LOC105319064 isoform X1 [Crassostrea gigas]|eukprot:XP_011414779.1 PREDICTED: uncharacterized protein LOC105319064 isoform X1 [Crassostrea gigas]